MSNKHKKVSSYDVKSKYKIWLRDLIILIVLISVVLLWQTRDMLQSDGSVEITQQNIVSLNGDVLPLLGNGKPNLVYFFAPWCQICSLSIGNLAYLNPEKVNVVVVALDYTSAEEVFKFVESHDVTVPVLLGHNDLKKQFSIKGYPSYYLIDQNNKVVSKSYGYSTALGLKLREVFGQ